MNYEVGKYYNVPCAELRNCNGGLIEYVPIIGGLHKDIQFGVTFKHYHVDGRFVYGKRYINVDNDGKTNQILVPKQSVKNYDNYVSAVVIKKKMCKRLTTGIDPPPKAKQYHQWYTSMIGKDCKGKKCPHLGTTMLEHNGKWICPLHNLFGDPKTETIVPIPNIKELV